MRLISVSGKTTQEPHTIFAIYTPNIEGNFVCLSSFRNYWDAKKKFLEYKTSCPDNYIYLVECSEQEYRSSFKNNKSKSFVHLFFPF